MDNITMSKKAFQNVDNGERTLYWNKMSSRQIPYSGNYLVQVEQKVTHCEANLLPDKRVELLNPFTGELLDIKVENVVAWCKLPSPLSLN